jgi:hypothetical protein
MGMIAFFAGLVIGILVGFLLLSLFAFFLAGGCNHKGEGYRAEHPLEP